jgi:hypothetical protein
LAAPRRVARREACELSVRLALVFACIFIFKFATLPPLAPSSLSVCHRAVKSGKQMSLIRVEFERILELSKQRAEPDLHYGRFGINLAGRSSADVRREADRLTKICTRPKLASNGDRESIRKAGSAENLAAEWAAAAIEYDAFIRNANLQAVKKNMIRQGIRSEMELARQAVCLAEAGRFEAALSAAMRLQYRAWRRLIGMIEQAQNPRV